MNLNRDLRTPPSDTPDLADTVDATGTSETADTIDTADTIARRAAMVTALVTTGELSDPRWRAAFEQIPRHVLVPEFFRSSDYTRIDSTTRPGQWLDAVYSDTTLVTRRTTATVTSSGTMPGLVAEMLHALDVHTGHRVLQVGTGTGYTAALLCAVLGDDRVTTVDVDPETVETARARLGRLGLRPTMLSADGWAGHPPSAPHDRILATCSLRRVPDPWLTQIVPGGRIVAPLARGVAVVDIETPVHSVPRATGRFTGGGAYFMPLRATGTASREHQQVASPSDSAPGRVRTSELGARDTVYHAGVRFLLSVALPDLIIGQHGPDLDDLTVHDRRGSWARLDTRDGQHTVTEGGPGHLWAEIEHVHQLWRDHDQPGADRFGIAIHGAEQTIQMDPPGGPSWPLPDR